MKIHDLSKMDTDFFLMMKVHLKDVKKKKKEPDDLYKIFSFLLESLEVFFFSFHFPVASEFWRQVGL